MSHTLGTFLRWQLAAFSAGGAAVHFAETSTHFGEYWVFGAFFFVVAWLQAVSSVLLVVRSDRRFIVAIGAVNLIVIAIWAWSRTAGLPIGPEAGEPEAIGAADLLATALEALVVVWAWALLTRVIGSRAASARLGLLTTVLVWVAVIVMTAAVFFTASPEAAMRH